MGSITYNAKSILIDGKPVQLVSGAIHYFRVPRQYWRDRLERARACGLNCIETYMCWNLHEPKEGIWDFNGDLDIGHFLSLVRELGMYAIVRPGPYICAEWENGGLPPYLMIKPGIEFRCMNDVFLGAVDRYYEQVLPILKNYEHRVGGPLIAVQVENEYGSYGQDKEYLQHVLDVHKKAGLDVLFFTSDGAEDFFIQGGTIPDCMMTLNFGSDAVHSFQIGRSYRPENPDMCTEFWNGWFDHWGEQHHGRDAESAAKELDDMLSMGASVSCYMFHGGTNFGFTNGANCLSEKKYEPTVTSYDYNAAVTECGDLSDKFFAFQQVIKKHFPDREVWTPAPVKKAAYGTVMLTQTAKLFDNLDNLGTMVKSVLPKPMEYFGQNFGFIHYRHFQPGPLAEKDFTIDGLHDRALIFIDGKYRMTMYRNDAETSMKLAVPAEGCTIDILVENMGRTNYGPLVGTDLKGICGGVRFWLQRMSSWEVWPLPLTDLSYLNYGPFCEEENVPAFHRGNFKAKEVADTFLELPGEKGIAFVNGHNLGRYWAVGPQKRLYVPGCYLQEGDNEIVIFELHKLHNGNKISLEAEPDLGVLVQD